MDSNHTKNYPTPGGSVPFDLFLSYSTDPDYALVRNIEIFLRTFHRLKLLHGRPLEELKVSVDGSSFLLGKGDKGSNNGRGYRFYNLARSKRFLVFCSKDAAVSKSVDFEIQWVLNQERAGDVMLAITEGGAIPACCQSCISPNVCDSRR